MRKDDVEIGQDYAVAHMAHANVRWRCIDIRTSGVGTTFGNGPLVMKKVNPENGKLIKDAPSVRMHARDLICVWRGFKEGWQKRNDQFKARGAAEQAVLDALASRGIKSATRVGVGPADNIGVMLSFKAAYQLVDLLKGLK